MEQSTLFTAAKWSIIDILGKTPMSPMQLAGQLGTTVANVSQQLRILEAYGIVTKHRLPNSGKGKPRLIYRIKSAQAFVALTVPGAPKQAMISLDNEQTLLLAIWSRFEGEERKDLTEWVAHLSSNIKRIDLVAYDGTHLNVIVHDEYVKRLRNLCVKHKVRFKLFPSSKSLSSQELESLDIIYRGGYNE